MRNYNIMMKLKVENVTEVLRRKARLVCFGDGTKNRAYVGKPTLELEPPGRRGRGAEMDGLCP